MFVQTQETPNPNSLKFITGKSVSEDGPYEFLFPQETENELLKNILSINGVPGIFLSENFLSVNKSQDEDWENIKHIVIAHINEYYAKGHEFIIGKKNQSKDKKDYGEIENKIIKILETKIRPAVARDGGDITFKEFKDGKVTVMLKGSCSGCPSSTLTLKQGVQNLLCHYIPEVKEVLAV